jgi:chemotaxis protein methyltransferase CheR
MIESFVSEVKLSESDFGKISDLIYRHCGINLHAGKKELVRARLAKRLRLLKIQTFPEYIEFALNDATGNEFTAMVDSISTNLTSFFRENQHFEYLQKEFLPAVMESKKNSGDSVIRAWSAGCSSGEEPYSIAITLLEAIGNDPKLRAKILATDISTRILEKAKAGVYDPERVSPVPAEQKHRYLLQEKVDGRKVFKAGKSLKDIIFFGQVNLMEEWPIKVPLDFIFCRNVMIYFDKPTQERLVNRYWNNLNPGGLLFTGHSESLTGINHKFRYVQPTIYVKP